MRSSFEISAPKVHVTNTSRRMRSERTVQTNCADRGNELRNCANAKQPGRATSARPQLSFQRVAQCARARLPRPCSPSSTVHGDRPKLHAQRTRARRGPSRSVCSNPARSASRPSRGPRDGTRAHVQVLHEPRRARNLRQRRAHAPRHPSRPIERDLSAHRGAASGYPLQRAARQSQRASPCVATCQRIRRSAPAHASQRANASVATCQRIGRDVRAHP
jgi:hypothetical protein